MSSIALPVALPLESFSLRLSVAQRASAAPFGGSEEVVDLLNDRWLASSVTDECTYAEGAACEAFIGAMRGQSNTTPLYHFARPAPVGTIRGTLLLDAAAAQGADTIVIKGCSPTTGTLKQGDLLGVGGLLLMVASDCTAVAGVCTVPITNRLRVAQLINAAVTWDKPTVAMRLLDTSGVQYRPGVTEPVSFDFGEAI